MNAPSDGTLAEAIRNRLGRKPVWPGSMVKFGPIALQVRGMGTEGLIERVGMVICSRKTRPLSTDHQTLLSPIANTRGLDNSSDTYCSPFRGAHSPLPLLGQPTVAGVVHLS